MKKNKKSSKNTKNITRKGVGKRQKEVVDNEEESEELGEGLVFGGFDGEQAHDQLDHLLHLRTTLKSRGMYMN